MRRKTAFSIFAVLIAATLIASGALLSYYGKVTTTATVEQSVVVSADGTNWNDYNEPITRQIDDMIHCTDYCYKNWIWNRACEDAPVSFDVAWLQLPGGDPTGFEIGEYLFGETQTIRLVQKVVDFGDSPWAEVASGIEANLTFSTCKNRFVWDIESTADLSAYSLIYYANYPDYWEGAPVFVIAGLNSGLSGSANIPTMPYTSDENAQRSINGTPIGESYAHDYGAKFWLVPTEAIAVDDVDWSKASLFLFETDLGFYMDCSVLKPIPLPNVYQIFSLISGDLATLKSGQTYCWITCNHVVMNIVAGIYEYQQTIQPQV